MASASEVAGLLALIGAGAGAGYFLFKYREQISEKMEKLKSERQRLRRKITRLEPDDEDAVNQDDIKTKSWRS